MNEANKEKFLTAAEVAKRVQASKRSVTDWCLAGYFPGARRLNPHIPGSNWRIPESAVRQFLARPAEPV